MLIDTRKLKSAEVDKYNDITQFINIKLKLNYWMDLQQFRASRVFFLENNNACKNKWVPTQAHMSELEDQVDQNYRKYHSSILLHSCLLKNSEGTKTCSI